MALGDETVSASREETHAFQADVARLLHMMVHSVYSDRSIFLRELISNAADACEKLRFEGISNAALLPGENGFAIRIEPDAEASTLTISDNGIGMSREEMIKALGTIARAKGMSQLSRDTGLGRESLYKALSGEGNPSFATILKVTTALGIKLHAQPMHVV